MFGVAMTIGVVGFRVWHTWRAEQAPPTSPELQCYSAPQQRAVQTDAAVQTDGERHGADGAVGLYGLWYRHYTGCAYSGS
eukprot:1864522-Rhodomonas_salina.3